ncbi:MAG TPA: heparan N-sulfatase [Planctomycetaceae bacterium]|nr:heparan N-sulfatase [Planctomycetaceae bacterium]
MRYVTPCYVVFAWWLGTALLFAAERPNVLLAISDDQSWPHASAYGSTLVSTPTFDRVAREGVLFTQAFCGSPGCSPSRASLLTGQHTWQIEHAGTHASYFAAKYASYPDRLEAAGYFVGYTGKGWAPGDWKKLGRKQNPAGRSFKSKRGSGKRGYVGAFAAFLEERPPEQPFCFWFGSHDAHRSYQRGSGLAKGMKLEDAEVPTFLPDHPEIRSDLLDYAFEVERFDRDVGQMLEMLAAAGELDNTLVIVTSDNGMPFPRAKANCYEYGIHMPLAIRWGSAVGGRTIQDLVGFVDLTATIYDVTGVAPPADQKLSGRSLASILRSDQEGVVEPSRQAVYAARERHSSSRFNSLGYPQRCLRTHDYLYIRNFKPERWPAGPGQKYAKASYDASGQLISGVLGPAHGGYHDIDGCPSLDFLIAHADDAKLGPFLELAVGLRPRDELFDIRKDPGCLHNLAAQPAFQEIKTTLSRQLMEYLRQTGDARVLGTGDVWESYPRVSSLRWFPQPSWVDDTKPLPKQTWLDARRPRSTK